jgi:CPA1 family monovalent cation:H+ antiporter
MPPADLESDAERRLENKIQLEMIEAQRAVLLSAIEEGAYSSELINTAMANLDADQIALEIKSAPAGH